MGPKSIFFQLHLHLNACYFGLRQNHIRLKRAKRMKMENIACVLTTPETITYDKKREEYKHQKAENQVEKKERRELKTKGVTGKEIICRRIEEKTKDKNKKGK
ncbi:hypothetical protein JTB14_014737 [Gonioctena quinquepunctata]|nr:hypothetical protein JTB14_014737 [Gonioctena quinquepunctata]